MNKSKTKKSQRHLESIQQISPFSKGEFGAVAPNSKKVTRLKKKMAAYQRFILLFTQGASEMGREHFATDFVYLLNYLLGLTYIAGTVLGT